MYMTLAKEKEMKNKGYRFSSSFDSEKEAKEYAIEKRSNGSKAFVGEYSTYVRGYHTYSVWCK